MLRVHSKDLHDHVVVEIGECLSSGLFTDIQVNCKVSIFFLAHKILIDIFDSDLIWGRQLLTI